MPEYIDSLEITDYSIVYGEGLEISNVELYEQDGRIFAKINAIVKKCKMCTMRIIARPVNRIIGERFL